MHFASAYGAFVARQQLTPAKAQQLAGAGLRAIVIQVDWQRSKLSQRTVTQLRDEIAAAHGAGLVVCWWAWCTPTQAAEAGRRPAGPRALEQRLAELVAGCGAPGIFFVDAEVGGGWRPRVLPELPDVIAAARAAGIARIGLTSHARITPSWGAEHADVGAPQLYDDNPVSVLQVRRSLETWEAAPCVWPVLSCADASSTPAEMRGDLATLRMLKIPGALWWTARQLRKDNGRLAAAVPSLEG